MPKIEQQKPGTPARPAITNGPTRPPVASGSSLFDSAVTVRELPQSGYKFLIFGLSGSGKTTLACSFPRPLFVIRPERAEEGTKSVENVEGVYSHKDVITDPDQIAELAEAQAKTNRFRSIVLDGVVRLQDLVVAKHMGWQDTKVQLTWGDVPQADWNLIGVQMKKYVRALTDLTRQGTNIIFVGGEKDMSSRNKGGEEGGRDASEIAIGVVMVALTPALTGWVHELFDYNVHTFKRLGKTRRKVVTEIAGEKSEREEETLTGKVEFCLHVGPACLPYATKFRKPKEFDLPEVVTNPSFAKLEKLIKGIK